MVASGLTIADLAQHCIEETQHFNLRQSSDPQFCFELMRRAFAEEVSEAFTHVCQIYQRQVMRWVYNHSGFEQSGESAEYFASSALSNLYFALRGLKFSRFRTLPQVLSYLKLCVHTTIMQYLRDQNYVGLVPLDEFNEPVETADLGTQIDASELWAHICTLLPDADDQLLAQQYFVQHLKPSQIITEQPGKWANERAISVALQRLRRILRNDAQIRDWAIGSN